MLELVVFDFDGIIVDSEPLHFDAVGAVLKEINIDLSWEMYCRKYLGYSDIDLFPAVIEDAGCTWKQEDIEGLMAKKAAIFADLARHQTIIFPGVVELLQNFQKNHIPAAICSGALRNEIEMMLDGSGLKKYFQVMVAADDVKVGKPNPQGYQLCLEWVGRQAGGKKLLPERCVAIEDSSWGIQAAKGAGMACVAVTNSYAAEELTEADKVVTSLNDVTCDFLHELIKRQH